MTEWKQAPHYRPNMLPKLDSPWLLSKFAGMPCTLRIAGFFPGHRCADPATVVPCHLPTIGKGMSTKVSDLFCAAGCLHCHDLLDGRDRRIDYINSHYPSAFGLRLMDALAETQSMLLGAGYIAVPQGRIVEA